MDVYELFLYNDCIEQAGIAINGLFAEILIKLIDAMLMIDSIAVNVSICSEV